jgi:hypothetical protein
MSRRVALLVLSVAAAGTIIIGNVVGSASAVTTDLLLKEEACGQTKASHCQIIGSPAGAHFGDGFVFSLRLLSRPGGDPVGRDEGECITLQRTAHAFYCDYVVHLEGGDVAVQGSIEFSSPSKVPVTGGTGAYEGASGFWRQSGQEVRLHIVTP